MKEYLKFHFYELPKTIFYIKFEKGYLKYLISLASMKLNGMRKLSNYLGNKCESIKKNTAGSALIKLREYQKETQFVPLDVVFELSDLTSTPLLDMEKKIDLLSIKYPKKPLKIEFPIKFDEDFASLSEMIRVEGYLFKNLRKIELANTDRRILKEFIKSLQKFRLSNKDMQVCLYNKISIPEGTQKKDILIFDETRDRKIKSFVVKDKELKNSIKRQIHFWDYNFQLFDDKSYQIIIKDKFIRCFVKTNTEKRILYTSSFNDHKSNISSAIIISVGNKTLAYLLNCICEIPNGKKSNKIQVPNIICNSPKRVVKRAFETTFNCEGNIEKDEICVRSISKDFLIGWQKLLRERFQIESQVNNHKLRITGKLEFIKFLEIFKLFEEERVQIERLTNRRDKLPQRKAVEFYLKEPKQMDKEFTSKELAQKLNKSTAMTKLILLELYRKNLIRRKVGWKKGCMKRYLYYFN